MNLGEKRHRALPSLPETPCTHTPRSGRRSASSPGATAGAAPRAHGGRCMECTAPITPTSLRERGFLSEFPSNQSDTASPSPLHRCALSIKIRFFSHCRTAGSPIQRVPSNQPPFFNVIPQTRTNPHKIRVSTLRDPNQGTIGSGGVSSCEV